MITFPFMGCGTSCVLHPDVTAFYLEQTNILLFLNYYSVALEEECIQQIVRGLGGLMILCSTFILAGVYRKFFSFFLAMMFAGGTAVFHIFSKETHMVTQEEKVDLLKNIAIIGGLLYVSGSGKVSRFSQAKKQSQQNLKKKQ